jgi:hypothetical protein
MATVNLTADPDMQYSFSRGSFVKPQIVLPTSLANGTGRSARLYGLGIDKTKLIADPSVTGAFLTTQGFVEQTPVISAGAQDVYLFGNQGITGTPHTDPAEANKDEVADAIRIHGKEQLVKDCLIQDFRGNGIYYEKRNLPSPDSVGAPQIINCTINHCWTGIYNNNADTQVHGCRVSNCRDYGLLDKVGAMTTGGNHFYGMATAMAFDNEWQGPAGSSKSVNDTAADCFIAFEVWASKCVIVALKAEHFQKWGIRAFGAQTCISDCTIKVSRTSQSIRDYFFPLPLTRRNTTGIVIEGQKCRVTGGGIFLSDYEGYGTGHSNYLGCVGISLHSSYNRIDTIVQANTSTSGDATRPDNQTGLLICNTNASENSGIPPGTPGAMCHGNVIDIHVGNFTGVNSFGVDIEAGALGPGNVINIWGSGTMGAGDPRLRVGAHNSNNVIRINGVSIYDVVAPGAAYPPPP